MEVAKKAKETLKEREREAESSEDSDTPPPLVPGSSDEESSSEEEDDAQTSTLAKALAKMSARSRKKFLRAANKKVRLIKLKELNLRV